MKYLHSYFASKHAVVSMTRTLGSNETFKETGVKVCSFFHIFPLFIFPPGSVHLSLFCRHCNLERPGRGEHEQDHAGEDLRHPHRGGGLRGLHAVGRELRKWSCCHCLQGDFSSLVSFVKIGMSTFRALRQWSSMTSAFLLCTAWPSWRWPSTRCHCWG